MFHFKTVKSNSTYAYAFMLIIGRILEENPRFNYDPKNWKSTDYILNYEDGCPLNKICVTVIIFKLLYFIKVERN